MSEPTPPVPVQEGLTRARASVGRRLAPIAIAFGVLGAACSSQRVVVPDLKDRGSETPRQAAWSCWTEAGDAVGTPPAPGRDDRLRSDGSRDVARRLPAMRACVQEAQRALPRMTYGISFPSGGEPAVACVGGPSPVPSSVARCLGRALAGARPPEAPGRRITAIEGELDPQSLPSPPPPAPRRARPPLAERCAGEGASAAASSAAVAPVPVAVPSSAAPARSGSARVSGEGTVTGGRVGAADRVLAGARKAVRACYQTSLDRDPELEGRLVFRMKIAGTGAVASACAGGDGLEEVARDCVLSVLSSLVFAAPDGGAAMVSGSFSFVNANLDPVAAWPWPAIAHAVPR